MLMEVLGRPLLATGGLPSFFDVPSLSFVSLLIEPFMMILFAFVDAAEF
jgi:hypothetical protein